MNPEGGMRYYSKKENNMEEKSKIESAVSSFNKGYESAKKELEKSKNMGKEANAGFTRDDSSTATRLLDKNWSPLIVRKYQYLGWPLFVAIICDANLNDLDTVVYEIAETAEKEGFTNGTIQGVRNFCGLLNDGIVKYYNSIKRGCTEGVLVCWYVDKMWCSAAFGDIMTHNKCLTEVMLIINTLPHI
jgi:hypothetical protein